MQNTRVFTVPINRSYEEAYGFLKDPRNYPKWSPLPGASFEPASENGLDWLVELPRGRRVLRFSPPNPFGVLDYQVLSQAGALEYTAPLRLIANEEGSVLVAIYFQRPEQDDAAFDSDVEWAANDLKAVAAVVERL